MSAAIPRSKLTNKVLLFFSVVQSNKASQHGKIRRKLSKLSFICYIVYNPFKIKNTYFSLLLRPNIARPWHQNGFHLQINSRKPSSGVNTGNAWSTSPTTTDPTDARNFSTPRNTISTFTLALHDTELPTVNTTFTMALHNTLLPTGNKLFACLFGFFSE